MEQVSFIARPYFLGNPSGMFANDNTIIRLSSQIRGEQVAEHLGAKYNPTEGFEKDLKIYIKPRSLKNVKREDWLDIADANELLEELKSRPDIRIIVPNQFGYEYLKKHYPNEVVYIHQQHLNWDREKRTRKHMLRAGYIGRLYPEVKRTHDVLKKRLEEIGVELNTCFNFKTRQDAIDFYKSIDVLVVADFNNRDHIFGTPTKMINAASFGIPSVAVKHKHYKEFEGYYITVSNMDEMVEEVRKLKDREYYDHCAEKAEKESEKYHISNVINNYRKLWS